MNIETMRFSHILGTEGLYDLNFFFDHTAFVIAHKNEPLETLLGVIWYLPLNSPVLIVTNCAESEKEALQRDLAQGLETRRNVYFVHQKDKLIADFFAARNVPMILGTDGRVVNGKGEGMYIGALLASLLGYPEWIVFYDADNFVPNALMEYTLAMSKLFMQERSAQLHAESREHYLHNIRICWSSKPILGSGSITPGLQGRCTRTVSPLMTTLVREWFGQHDCTIVSSNAGEQAFTMKAMQTLRFSSGYAIETFQLLELLSQARNANEQGLPHRILLQQYQAQSPHFHEKRDDIHIKRMIADSLGSFCHFQEQLPVNVERQIEQICQEMELDIHSPVVYPALQRLVTEKDAYLVQRYHLFEQPLPAGEVMCG